MEQIKDQVDQDQLETLAGRLEQSQVRSEEVGQ